MPAPGEALLVLASYISSVLQASSSSAFQVAKQFRARSGCGLPSENFRTAFQAKRVPELLGVKVAVQVRSGTRLRSGTPLRWRLYITKLMEDFQRRGLKRGAAPPLILQCERRRRIDRPNAQLSIALVK